MGLGNSEDVAVDDGDGADGSRGKTFGESSVPCSICLEVVAGSGDRSLAKLQCGHQFHLDCIGSAFNAKGAMQCPNCRKIEKGQWLYANGCRSFPEFSMEDWARDEDLYDLSYSEMSYGVHWCPFGQLARIPSSFEEEEFSSTAYHDLLGQHAIFSEPTPVSSATHPCPYIAYFGPVHPSSSSSTGNVSDSSNFSNHWNGPSEVPTTYAFPGMDLHYRSGEHHHHHQPSIPAVAPRSARANSDISRSGSLMHHPFLVGHSSAARPGSSVGSSMIPPYPGSNARARDRVQALQAYYQQQQPSNARAPVVSGTRRSSSNRRVAQPGPVALPSTDQNAGFYYFQSGASGHSFQEPENQLSNHFHAWGRDHLPSFSLNQVDRDFGWGAFHHHAAGGSDSSSSLRQRHGSERTPSQNRSYT